MDQNQPEARPPLTKYEDLAKMIDHSLLRPELTGEQVAEGCRIARQYQVANVTVRPCDVDFAVRQMEGSGVLVGSVAGFPHGSSTTAAKLYESRDLLRRGAREVDMVINISKLLSRQFQHVDTEVQQMADACHEQRAILKVIFENAYLTDELKIVACRICGRAGADFVKTSTGFAPTGYTLEDLRLMRAHTNPDIQIKAAGGVRTLDAALEVYQAGCSRFGATATVTILEEWKARLKQISLSPAATGVNI
jgi:deoxyribose-phosphate aldolase